MECEAGGGAMAMIILLGRGLDDTIRTDKLSCIPGPAVLHLSFKTILLGKLQDHDMF